MTEYRKIKKVFKSKVTLEGAGVHLKRAFGFDEVKMFDPFLLLDDFRSNNPEYYMKGFPWHPHRGIETITYVLKGNVEHGDGMGNSHSNSEKSQIIDNESLVLFEDGEAVQVTTADEPVRFLLFSGKPIGEPIAWYGPIVMNREGELRTAFEELERGTFVKKHEA